MSRVPLVRKSSSVRLGRCHCWGSRPRSRCNLSEIFFAVITRQAIRRGTFADVTDLQTAIRTYIDNCNRRAKPFAWTKTADELLGKINT